MPAVAWVELDPIPSSQSSTVGILQKTSFGICLHIAKREHRLRLLLLVQLTWYMKKRHQEVAAQYGLPTDETQSMPSGIIWIGAEAFAGWSLHQMAGNKSDSFYQSPWPKQCYVRSSFLTHSPVHSVSQVLLTNCVWELAQRKIECGKSDEVANLKLDKANQSLKSLSYRQVRRYTRHASACGSREWPMSKRHQKLQKFFLLARTMRLKKAKATLDVACSDWSNHPTKREAALQKRRFVSELRVRKLDLLKETRRRSREKARWFKKRMRAWRRSRAPGYAAEKRLSDFKGMHQGGPIRLSAAVANLE